MTTQSFFKIYGIVVFGIGIGLAQPVAAGEFQLIARSGDVAPDGNGALSLFAAPVLNSNGQTAFFTLLSGTAGGDADDFAFYRSDGTSLTRIARDGGSMVDGETIGSITPFVLALNSGGTGLASVQIVGQQSSFTILGSGGPLQRFPRPGEPSPSGNNSLFAYSQLGINDSGVGVYRGLYSGINQEAGIYLRNVNESYTTLLLEGASGPQGGTIDSLFTPTINASAQIGILGELDVAGQIQSVALRLDTLGTTELARRGDILSDGITVLEEFRNGSPINVSGNLAFSADFSQPGKFKEGVFLATDDGVTLLAQGTLPGGTIAANFIEVADLNAANQVTFTAEVTPGFDRSSGIYVADTDGVQLIALENTLTPRGDHFFHHLYYRNIASNDLGQTVFMADLADEIDGGLTGRGLFFYDPDLGLEQVLTTGDAYLGDTVSGLDFEGVNGSTTTGPGPQASGANDQGQFAFLFSLTNSGDQGIAVWSPSSVPGDIDGDGDVDGADFLEWQLSGGSASSLADWEANYGTALPGDFDLDGDVDGTDFLEWQQGLGTIYDATDLTDWEATFSVLAPFAANSATVPEPATLGLVLIALVFLPLRVHRAFVVHE